MFLRTISNARASFTIDLLGGAYTGFDVEGIGVNPFSFAFTAAQMPPNNRDGAPYKGHFACIGRWGRPSPAEILRGVPDHGQPANLLWESYPQLDASALTVSTIAPLEGLAVKRVVEIDEQQPVVAITENVTNIDRLGRLYNVVQHPTLAAPFLDEHIIVDCNAAVGFNQSSALDATVQTLLWPYDVPSGSESIHSFIVGRQSVYGWITAYSPTFQCVLGYFWKRSDYPWIHLWQQYLHGEICYRGLEFGTTGVHQPFARLVMRPKILSEPNFDYIEPDECIQKKFLCFFCQAPVGAHGVSGVEWAHGTLTVHFQSHQTVRLPTHFGAFFNKSF
jgi:hypothetical protein